MTAERESMTLQEMGAPALGVEERRDEAPRAGASHARPTPDPEVVAKPKRRKFTAQYRLRILEEADRCTQPGEVGRLLRREGLYSSHLTEWRRARRKGSLRELAAKKRGAKPAELPLQSPGQATAGRRRAISPSADRNPLDAKVRALEAQVARLEHELHTAHTILDVQGKVAGPRRSAARNRPNATRWMRRCARSRRKWLAWSTSCTPRTRSWTCREKLPGCWD